MKESRNPNYANMDVISLDTHTHTQSFYTSTIELQKKSKLKEKLMTGAEQIETKRTGWRKVKLKKGKK